MYFIDSRFGWEYVTFLNQVPKRTQYLLVEMLVYASKHNRGNEGCTWKRAWSKLSPSSTASISEPRLGLDVQV